MAYANARGSRLPGVLAAIAVQAVLILAIVRGLSAHYRDAFPPAPDTTLVALPEPARQPAPPPPPPDEALSGEGAPPGLKAEPRPQEAPPPLVVLAEPRPASTQPGSGTAANEGEALTAGVGSGAGGSGDGSGRGAGGAGSGAGIASAAQRIAGSLDNRDYPRSAAARGAAGTVAISFRVGSDGRVRRCSVIGTSGDVELDRLTCELVERRFVYRPARNFAGQPVETTLRTTFTWGTIRR
jgi:protein TonB